MTVRIACLAGWGVLSLAGMMSFGFSWLILLSTALTVGVLYVVAASVDRRGWPLFRLLAALYGGIVVINIQIESFVFGMLHGPAVVRATLEGMATGLIVVALVAAAFTGVRNESRVQEPHRLPPRLWWRVPLVAGSYIVLYLVAGLLIYPLVLDFYETSDVFTNLTMRMLLLTELVRGLVYIGALAPLFVAMDRRRGRAALLAGLSLSVLGGVAPLLMPVDEILPWAMRRVHMVEILWSNFTFGAVAAWLLVRRRPAPAPAPAATAAEPRAAVVRP